MNIRTLVDQLNADLATRRTDIEWVVGAGGTPVLVDRAALSATHAQAEAERKEEERRKFNWRQDHPVTETRDTA